MGSVEVMVARKDTAIAMSVSEVDKSKFKKVKDQEEEQEEEAVTMNAFFKIKELSVR